MNHFSKEVRRLFVSDMGFVADYLNEGSFEGRRNQRIIHIEALYGSNIAGTLKAVFVRRSVSGGIYVCSHAIGIDMEYMAERTATLQRKELKNAPLIPEMLIPEIMKKNCRKTAECV